MNCNTQTINEFSLDGLKTIGKIVEVYDGDTCKIVLINENKLIKFNCRLIFIDCPELKPPKNKVNRHNEILQGLRARNRFIQLATNCACELNNNLSKKEITLLLKNNKKIISLECYKFDKYGRLLVRILDKGKNLNEILISEGFGKKYEGGKKDYF